jgi:hypothetical protein
MLSALILGLFLACDKPGDAKDPGEKVDTGGPPVEEPVDADGDGSVEADDCNDNDANVNPDAEEICDGVDNNCDDEIDNDATDALTFYQDTDGDGFGNPEMMEAACEAAEGYVDNMDDCDDSSGDINPDAAEVCDEMDNDCDGDVDDADEDVDLETGMMVYADTDTDGLGDMAAGMMSCAIPEGYVEDSSDCDDTDTAIGAIDVDGDGFVACVDDCDDDDAEIGATDVDGDGFVACVDDCDDDDAMTFPGAAEAESETSCMRDMDDDGFGDVDVKNCIQVEMFDTYGDAWNGSPPAAVLSTDEAHDVIEEYTVTSSDECVDETATVCDPEGGDYGPESYLSVEFCATTEEITVMYRAGVDTSYNEENAIRVTDSDGMVWEYGPRFVDATTGEELAPLEEDLILATIAVSAVAKGSDCDDTDVEVGSGDLDGDGYDACDIDNPRDCDDSDAAINPGVDADDDLFNMCVDCDDADAAINPDATEVWYDGIDTDCDGWSDYDMDMDGSDAMTYIDPDTEEETSGPGYDCNDEDPTLLALSMEDDDTLCYSDADGDGYGDMDPTGPEMEAGAVAGTDCEDYYSGGEHTYPGAAELEDDPTLCMKDADEDGYGDEAGMYDYFESGTDCDDYSEFTYPGAAELEDDPTLCMEDEDEDGYGSEAGMYDYFESGTDCDDTDADISPDIDVDADGVNLCIDCDDADSAVGEASLAGYEDIDGDGYGSGEETMVCSLDADGDGTDEYVSMGGDCYDSSWSSSAPYIYPGAAYEEPDIDGDGVDDCTEDADGDGYGSMDSYDADVTGTDCDDDDESTFPGAGYMELSPLDEQCLTDSDADGYAVSVSGLYEASVTSGECFVVEMFDQYSDGCGAFSDMYMDGVIETSIEGPAYGLESEETGWCAPTTGFWQVGWTEDATWNSDCELYIYDFTGVEIYGSGSETISGTVPGGGTDVDDSDSAVH